MSKAKQKGKPQRARYAASRPEAFDERHLVSGERLMQDMIFQAAALQPLIASTNVTDDIVEDLKKRFAKATADNANFGVRYVYAESAVKEFDELANFQKQMLCNGWFWPKSSDRPGSHKLLADAFKMRGNVTRFLQMIHCVNPEADDVFADHVYRMAEDTEAVYVTIREGTSKEDAIKFLVRLLAAVQERWDTLITHPEGLGRSPGDPGDKVAERLPLTVAYVGEYSDAARKDGAK